MAKMENASIEFVAVTGIATHLLGNATAPQPAAYKRLTLEETVLPKHINVQACCRG